MLRHTTLTTLAMAATCAAWTSHASARPANGGWYALQDYPDSGVIEFTAGGDLSAAPRYASGSSLWVVAGMCYGGPHDDLYVATPYSNAVYKATPGGSMDSTPPFAYQFPGFTAAGYGDGVMALSCSASRVLGAVLATGSVFDITHGGDMTNAQPFARGLPPGQTVDVFTDSTGKIWAVSQTVGIYDITAGGDFSQTPPTFPYDLGGPWGIGQVTEMNGHLYFVEEIDATWSYGTIYDFTALQPGDPLSTATPFAWGFVAGVGLAASADRMMVTDACPGFDCTTAVIYEATAGGDLSAATPFAGGFSAAYQPAEDLVYIPYCGDGSVWPNSNETCDPGTPGGETANCDSDCTAAACGDGLRNVTAGEECDDGTDNSNSEPDACRTSCVHASCGDGTVDTGEECDEGADNADTADHCRTTCVSPMCGDAITDTAAGEECDDGASNSDSTPDACRTDCSSPLCGDGITDTAHGEECDDGADNADTADHCRTTCLQPACGDGIVDTGEECDDGNTVDDDGCSASCTSEGTGGAGGGTGGQGAEGGQGAGGGSGGSGNWIPVLPAVDAPKDACSCRLAGARSDRRSSASGLLGLAVLGLGGLRRRRPRTS
jgi:cysteine-rich repeat protein